MDDKEQQEKRIYNRWAKFGEKIGMPLPKLASAQERKVKKKSAQRIVNFDERRILIDIYPELRTHFIAQDRRYNRLNQTESEKIFEKMLFQLTRGTTKCRYIREYALSSRWIVDFYFPKKRIAVEIDGGYHTTKEQKDLDILKEKSCEDQGITLFRFTNQQILQDPQSVWSAIRKIIA